MSLRSLTTIADGDEIVISYIDITEPTLRRQSTLQSRYYFKCACSACSSFSTCGQPDTQSSLENTISATELTALEEKGYRSLDQVAKAASAEEQFTELEETMALFAVHKGHYPYWRQPWPSMRHQMKLAAISRQNWSEAIGHSLKAYFHIDPFLFPTKWHPVRIVGTYVLLKLVMEVSFWILGPEEDRSVQECLDRYQVDWVTVAWYLMQEVDEHIGKSHGVESAFAKDFNQLKENGVPKPRSKTVIDIEWTKLRKIADGTE